MANTFSQIYLQLVFAVQNRISLIHESWKDELYKYISGIIQNNNHKLIIINGIPNHVHILIDYKIHQKIPDLMKHIKGYSSKWINDRSLVHGKFKWQEGFGAFSYSQSQLPKIIRYIKNQEKHHNRCSFKEEYIKLLDKFNIHYDERYVPRDVF